MRAAMSRGSLSLLILRLFTETDVVESFAPLPLLISSSNTQLWQSSFAADGSEYSSKDSTSDHSEDEPVSMDAARFHDEDDDSPTIELEPVSMSKNAGNRFVAICMDDELVTSFDRETDDVWSLHSQRIARTEDHVLCCRKANLYNETFNTDSMVDVLWSLPILSVDLQRLIGHAICLESTALEHVYDFLQEEPLTRWLMGMDNDNDDGDADDRAAKMTASDIANRIPLYRWRHIRDYTLRIDDGRSGYPCMCWALDDKDAAGVRESTAKETLKYWIESERVIAAGPLFEPTSHKPEDENDAIGDFILFNAKSRDDAIDFAENMPSAEAGLYEEMRAYFYNRLDITGKFVSEDPLRDAPNAQMKEAMEEWGYPVADEQTPWLNW